MKTMHNNDDRIVVFDGGKSTDQEHLDAGIEFLLEYRGKKISAECREFWQKFNDSMEETETETEEEVIETEEPTTEEIYKADAINKARYALTHKNTAIKLQPEVDPMAAIKLILSNPQALAMIDMIQQAKGK